MKDETTAEEDADREVYEDENSEVEFCPQGVACSSGQEDRPNIKPGKNRPLIKEVE